MECKYNIGVDCQKQDKCEKCGWNPAFVKEWLKKHYDYPKPNDIVCVVRCKDCRYGRAMNKREAELYADGCVMCNRISVSGEENAMLATDFCSMGAKMDGKGEGE